MPDGACGTSGLVFSGPLAAKATRTESIDVTFTLRAGHTIDICDGCADNGTEMLDARHEHPAAHAATGCAHTSAAEHSTLSPGVPHRFPLSRHYVLSEIGYGQAARYSLEREPAGNTLGEASHHKSAQAPGHYGEKVRDPDGFAPAALQRSPESGRRSPINVWVNSDKYVQRTMNQTMHK
jgi:thiamine pyrophosphate-dependent acetolactate synthase large subunit-like protein